MRVLATFLFWALFFFQFANAQSIDSLHVTLTDPDSEDVLSTDVDSLPASRVQLNVFLKATDFSQVNLVEIIFSPTGGGTGIQYTFELSSITVNGESKFYHGDRLYSLVNGFLIFRQVIDPSVLPLNYTLSARVRKSNGSYSSSVQVTNI